MDTDLNNKKKTSRHSKPSVTLFMDGFLLILMATLAACGLIYEYLFSHYAGRVLGVMDQTIFVMIGIMIVAMGIGAYLSRLFRHPYHSLIILESLIAILGATGIVLISFLMVLPKIMAQYSGMIEGVSHFHTLHMQFETYQYSVPFVVGFVIAIMLGMEIPLIARIRQNMYPQHLKHNAGTIYGADYIGAGIGAFLFAFILIMMPIHHAAHITSVVNWCSGILFILVFWRSIQKWWLIFGIKLISLCVLLWAITYSESIEERLEQYFYADPIVERFQTDFQHVVITKNHVNGRDNHCLFLNGHTQFCSQDEAIYHEMLVHPVMHLSNILQRQKEHKRVLVIGGGDGLVLRHVLFFNPHSVDIVDIDHKLVDYFSGKDLKNISKTVQDKMLDLNDQAFLDSRVHFIKGDAFTAVQSLLHTGKKYDAVIIDLPDPSHPHLDKLYSVQFYDFLHRALDQNGVLAVQSTSPSLTPSCFGSMLLSLRYVGFSALPYHQHVPSFGEWGFIVAAKNQIITGNKDILSRWKKAIDQENSQFISGNIFEASTVFSKSFWKILTTITHNRLGSMSIYRYYIQDLQKDRLHF